MDFIDLKEKLIGYTEPLPTISVSFSIFLRYKIKKSPLLFPFPRIREWIWALNGSETPLFN